MVPACASGSEILIHGDAVMCHTCILRSFSLSQTYVIQMQQQAHIYF